jgi:hypothetical protein
MLSSGDIGGDPELMLEQMRKFALTISEFPVPARLAESRGTGEGVANGFRDELTHLARDLQQLGVALIAQLENIEQAVRTTAHELAETDAQAAEDANRVLAQLEGRPDLLQAAPTPSPVSAPSITKPVRTFE